MSDTLRIVMEQIDEEADEKISRVVAEWYNMDRNDANAMSVTLTDSMVQNIRGLASAKAGGIMPADLIKTEGQVEVAR